MISFITKYVHSINDKRIISLYQEKINKICSSVQNKKCLGANFIGWMDKKSVFNIEDINQMINIKKNIQRQGIKNLVIIGIGGSYLGIKAAYDMLKTTNRCIFDVFFIHNIHSNYLFDVLNKLVNQKYCIIVISKSGNTLEPALAFNIFKKQLISKWGKQANNWIIAITDKQKGLLCQQAIKNKWTRFIVPNNIGGRYSALSPVGLLPMIFFGFDYQKIITGYDYAIKHFLDCNLKKNTAFLYACYRHYLYCKKNIKIENFTVYDPYLESSCKVWQQLFGESEGKNKLGLYPTTSLFTTDLHSLGQFLQDGTKSFFESTLFIKQPIHDQKINAKNDNAISYLNNKKISSINEITMISTVKAHSIDGNIDNFIIYLDKYDEQNFAIFYIWLCCAAMASAFLLKLNPFDQPGVEIYKKRIKEIINK